MRTSFCAGGLSYKISVWYVKPETVINAKILSIMSGIDMPGKDIIVPELPAYTVLGRAARH